MLGRLPPMTGGPIRLEWGTEMRAHRGRLRFGEGPGMEVHAASFIRERRLVLDRSLLKQHSELARILCHEVFHFVWVRLSNTQRREWVCLLASEAAAGARGEMGWSSEMRKAALSPKARVAASRRWREYACESFCDTAAWLYGSPREHPEYTLKARFRALRRQWFQRLSSHRKGGLRI